MIITPIPELELQHVAAVVRLSHADELTDDVRDQLREHAVALRRQLDWARARIRALESALASADRGRQQSEWMPQGGSPAAGNRGHEP